MLTVGQAFNKNSFAYPDELARNQEQVILGLEIELEQVHHQALMEGLKFKQFWNFHQDGSIAPGGLEYTFEAPQPDFIVPSLVHDFTQTAKRNAKAGPTAGIHVHVQATTFSYERLTRLLLLYALVEPELYWWAGIERSQTRFCRPWWLLGTQEKEFWKALGSGKDVHLPVSPELRYSALNLAALSKFGTLEFRHLPSTLDPERILKWITFLTELTRSSSKNYPLDKLEQIKTTPQTIFSSESEKELHLSHLPISNLGIQSYRTLRLLMQPPDMGKEKNESWTKTTPCNALLELFLQKHPPTHSKKRKPERAQLPVPPPPPVPGGVPFLDQQLIQQAQQLAQNAVHVPAGFVGPGVPQAFVNPQTGLIDFLRQIDE